MFETTSRPLKLIAVSLVIWAAISSASILVVASGATGEVCAFWRLFYTVLILLPFASRHPRKTGVKWYHFVSGSALAAHFLLWMKSLYLIPVYYSTLLVTIYPLIALLLEYILLGISPSPSSVFALVLAFTTLIFFLKEVNVFFNAGAVMALIAGVAASIYFVIGKYARSRVKEDTVTYVISTYFFATIFALIYLLISGVSPSSSSLTTHIYFVAMALVPMLLGHTLMNYLLRYLPAHAVSSISLGEPFGAGLLASIFLGQEIGFRDLAIGLLLVFFIFVAIARSREDRNADE